jgi:hypothetical protein
MDLTADVVQETGTYTITFTSGFIRIFGQVRVVHLFNFMCCIYFVLSVIEEIKKSTNKG